jgi:ribonuclease PH
MKKIRHADVDFNAVMTASGKFVEIQGLRKRNPFPENNWTNC